MSVKDHIEALNAKHKKLKQKIHEARTHYLPVNELKRQKLQIKDEILALSNKKANG